MHTETGLPVIQHSEFPSDDHEIVVDRYGPYKKLHRALRGRYVVLLALAAAGAMVGGIYGFRRSSTTYRSEGLIQVAYTLPAVMQNTDQNGPMQMYEEFLQSQVLLIGSKEVLGQALKDPAWNAAAGKSPVDVGTFAAQLLVEHPPRTQAIRVSYVSTDPDAAAAGVRAVIASYIDIAKTADTAGDVERLQVLNGRKVDLTRQIRDVIEKMPEQPVPLSANQIAMFDDLMRDYLKQLNSVQSELAVMQMHGAGPQHPIILTMQKELERLKAQMHQYEDDFKKMQLALAAGRATSGDRVAVMPQYQSFQTVVTDLRKELDETTRRMEMLQLESSSVQRRLTILSQGDVPATAYKDHRALSAAAMGFAGAFCPAALLAFFGLTGGRLRYSDDANMNSRHLRLLGILPRLPGRISDPMLAGIASHCIHQLRLKLQLMGQSNRRVFMITSCCAGEGKTSLTMALGLSFAASNSKTLIIDADTVGQSLTSRLEAKDARGLIEAVDHPTCDNCKQVAHNLWFLPTGQCQDLDPMTLSPGTMDQLLLELRQKFDYILIDTGPILASLEASTIAMSADEVILTISQNQKGSVVREACKILSAMNASIPGYVFNKAVRRDYGRVINESSSKYFSSRSQGESRVNTRDSLTASSHFGPLVQSVKFFKPERARNGSADAIAS